MLSSAVEGIRLELKVDSFPVSVNVALPAGMVVNELLTNALKHAFVGRDRGTIMLHSLADDRGCRVVVADDGVGLPPDISWPKSGKLGQSRYSGRIQTRQRCARHHRILPHGRSSDGRSTRVGRIAQSTVCGTL
jgi:two-component sensor histidine kinase